MGEAPPTPATKSAVTGNASPDDGAARLWGLIGAGTMGFAGLTLVLGGLTMVAVRSSLLASFTQMGAPLPGLSEVALSGAYAPAWAGLQLVCLVAAGLSKGLRRVALAGTSLVLGTLGLGTFVIAAWLPFFTFAASS